MRKVVALVVGFCAFAFLAFSAAPDLLRDTAHRGHWIATHEWAAEKAKCRRYSLVMSHCSVTAVQRFSPSGEKRSLTYLTFADWGGRSIQFVRSTQDSRVIAIRSAVDGLTGRWAFFLAMIGGIAAVATAGLGMLRSRMAKPAFT
ncbi:MAG TPA: hypothetical protein VE443_13935 [Beijerinckiaceae bacterium]|jgi:hypothetical protein|nr:hypothetical protein [Microvirga sp.]HZB39084.1 hypothetical protein [Beijerinckiaceae bacterium]